MKNDAVKEVKTKVNEDTTKKDEADSTSTDGINAPHSKDNNDVKSPHTDSEYAVSNHGEVDHDSKNGLNSTPTDEKPSDIVNQGNVDVDEAISVA